MSDPTTFEVRIWKTRPLKRKKSTTYQVRWSVAKEPRSKVLATSKLADSFRSQLVTAARNGEPFDVTSGLPVALLGRDRENEVTWYDNAVAFADAKWPDASPRHRKGTAEGLANLTVALTVDQREPPDPDALRAALRNWAFNLGARRDSEAPPDNYAEALTWISANSIPVADLEDREVARRALDAISVTLTGKRAATSVINRKRAALSGALKHAVDRKCLASNPLPTLPKKHQPPVGAIDKGVVVNPKQARALLAAVKEISSPLHAYFACMYYAGHRPGESRDIRETDCVLPEAGWGEIVLTGSYQEPGQAWTDDGANGEQRGLKHRHASDSRPTPAHPELVRALRDHLDEFGTGVGGRLFVARTGRAGVPISPPYAKPVSMKTVYRVWEAARRAALTEQQVASPLAARPYDLRHACLSTWLNAGVPAPRVAAWAGHSVTVLHKVYSKCIDGEEEAAKKRIEASLAAHS